MEDPKGQKPTASDFDFSSFETSGKHDRFSDNAIDSDVEDAIYASVYFTARDESHQSPIEGNVLESSGPSLSGDSEEGGVRWSVSLALSSSATPSTNKASGGEGSYTPAEKSSKGKGKAGTPSSAVKLKRRKGSIKNDAKRTRTSDTGDFVVMDSYTAAESTAGVIDLTGDSIDVPSEALEESPSTTKSQRRRQRVKERKRKKREQDAGKANAMEGKDGPSRSKQELDSSAAEADVQRLFSQQEEPAVIVLSSDGESSGDREGVVSTGSSSIESGELVGSAERSRVNSDMDICSDNSVELTKIEDSWKICEKDRLGAEAYERLHGIGDSIGRYYGERNTKCTNCKQRGHSAKTCPWPKRHTVCYLCAEHGHISSNCPKNLCTYCFRAKHRGMTCQVPWAGRGTVCTRCFMRGHHASICPDHWRQFHHTTYDNYNLVTSDLGHQRRMDKVYCSNCSSRGHFGFECTRTIPRGNPAYYTPLVAVYDQSAWPPRDPHSREVIRRALASRAQVSTPDASSSPPSGRKRAREEKYEDEQGAGRRTKISPPSKKNREASPQSSGKKRRNSKSKRKSGRNSEEFDARDLIDERESLLITVDGRGSVQDPSPLVNHVHLRRDRPSLLGTPRLGPMPVRDFPRVPHPSPYHSPPEFTPHFPLNQGGARYNAQPGGQGAWHYNNPDHTFTPLAGGAREVIHRSLSAGDHHLPSQHYRRHSEQLDRRSQHDYRDNIPPLTPTYPRPRNANRGGLVSHRGFQMSVEAAHRTGLYGESPSSGRYGGPSTDSRRHSQEHMR